MSSAGPFELAPIDGSLPFVEIGPDGLGFEATADGNCRIAGIPGVSPTLARVHVDRRGVVLAVDSRTPLHVNGRPVRELALLRPGDAVVIGRCVFLLRTVAVPASPPEPPPVDPAPNDRATRWPRAWLRCLAGRHAGQVRAVLDGTTLPWADANNGPGARFSLEGGRLAVRAIRTDALMVDGHRVRAAVLHGGEQLVVGGEHHVLDGVALEPQLESGASAGEAESESPATADAVEGDKSTDAAGGFSPWWLLAAAVVIAGALALLFGRL